MSSFKLTLPSNLLNAQSAADQDALNAKWNDFFSHQKLPLTDSTIAQQLQALQAGEKADETVGIQEIQADLAVENKMLADRSLLEQGWDAASHHHSDTKTYLNEQLHALQDLQQNKSNMSAADYNDKYLQIMGNVSTRFGVLSEKQHNTSKDWQTAENVVETAAAATAAIVVTTVTAGTGAGAGAAILAGTVAGFATQQSFAAAQNLVTASEGGDVNDNSQVSLLTPLTNNFGYGGVSWNEMGHAAVNAGTDAVISLTTAAGV